MFPAFGRNCGETPRNGKNWLLPTVDSRRAWQQCWLEAVALSEKLILRRVSQAGEAAGRFVRGVARAQARHSNSRARV